MPWALFNRPSIQLGALKAFVESRIDVVVDTNHPYLEVASRIGPDLYHWISRNLWVSEALYAPLVFPQQTEGAKTLANRYVQQADARIKRSFDYHSLLGILENQLEKWLESYNWSQYKIIGFSVCFHQLFASLAAASAIKKICPEAIIVFGGSSCSGTAGLTLLNAFPCLDYVALGEGEKGLLTLFEYITANQAGVLPGHIVGRHTSQDAVQQWLNQSAELQLPGLLDLPIPDYYDYFEQQKKWFSHTPFIPQLPVEFSRGCWWNRCTFCNLNLQWCGYRCKNAPQMLQEVKILATRHGCLDFAFADNMLPPLEARQFFTMSGEDSTDFNFFAEIRASGKTQPLAEIFPIYRKGGLTTIQVGIESLSSSLLQKMRKGITVIENIATMRAAQENFIQLEGNLILQFPGSSSEEAAETLVTLDYVFPYRPLVMATFFLGLGSPIHQDPQRFGIKTIVNHINNYKLFPKNVLQHMELLIKDYRGGRANQRKIWQPVVRKIKKWQQYHAERQQDALNKPLLYYRDGGDFLLIRQELPDGNILHHRLRNMSRQIYLFCTRIRTDSEIYAAFPALKPERIHSFLADLQKKRILFSEKNKYLALAIHYRA